MCLFSKLVVSDCYSALQQESALSHFAHAAESQHEVESAQQAVESAQHLVLSSHFVHSVAFSHFLQLLQQEHEAKASIAQAIAKVLNTFFMASNI